MIEVARAAHQAGLCVVPPREDGTKAPEGSWKKYIEHRPDDDQIEQWYSNGRQGIGVVCGKVSGGLECFEFEAIAVAENLPGEYRQLCEAAGLGDVLNRVLMGYTEETPSGGMHVLWRCEEIGGNQKLARRPSTKEERATDPNPIRVLIETRGEGGYVVVAPSNGLVHPSGRPWKLVRGGFNQIATITPQERSELLRLARVLDRTLRQPAHTPEEDTSDRPGDAFNNDPQAQEHIRRLLLQHGWNQIYGKGDALYLRRPGKERGVSATLGYTAPGVFYCFSTSTIFEAEKGYSPFQVYAFLEHKGDFSAAAKALSEGGYGGPSTARDDVKTTTSSWEPIDLKSALRGEGPPPATILHRSDGVALFYSARVNALAGEPESGKGWIALRACVEELVSGHNAVYIDFEDTERLLVQRLQELGVPDEVIERQVFYIRPTESVILKDLESGIPKGHTILDKLMRSKEPTVVIIDGVSEALSIEGLDPVSNKDVTRWLGILPRFMANLGPAVILIDHVTKDREGRGRWALGAQAKLAGVDGSSYVVEIVHPLGRGCEGELRLKLSKDRLGYVAEHQVGDIRMVAKVFVGPHEDMELTIRVEPPPEMKRGQKPTFLMEKVSKFLEARPEGASKRAIRDGISGKAKYVGLAISELVTQGYIQVDVRGGPSGHIHKLVRPYREEDGEDETDQA